MKVAIVEDEATEQEKLVNYLNQYQSETGNIIQVSCFSDADRFLMNYKPDYDLVLMDIELKGSMNGMQAAKLLRERDEYVALIFVTNVASLAINGYSVGAMDYFVKPVTYNALKMRIERIMRNINLNRQEKYVFIRHDRCIEKINVLDLFYVEVVGHTLIYHLRSGIISTTGKLSDAERDILSIDKNGFSRCSISYLVNLRFCTKFDGNFITCADTIIRVTRGYRKSFTQDLMRSFNAEEE